MPKLTRRKFVESGVALTVGASLAPIERVWAATTKPDLVDVHGQSPSKMVISAIEALGGIQRFVKKGDYVLLKPNAAFAVPVAWGATTHPETVVAVAKLCLNAGAKKVTVVEFPQAKGMKCLDRCGLTKAMTQVPEAKIKLLSKKSDFKTVKIKKGKALQSVEVAKVLLSSDVYINIPAAKAHNATGASFGLKNAMGLIYDRHAFHTQFDLHQGIADLAQIIKAQLTLVDGTRALITNGPQGPGESSTPNRLVAGTDIVATDAFALTFARYNHKNMRPADVRHIQLAAEAKLGEADITKLNIKKVQI